MVRRVLVVAAVALFAGSAAAIDIGVADFYARIDAVASHLALDLDMSEAGLAEFWPEAVEKLADLPPVVATVNDPDRLSKALGSAAAFQQDDFAILSPFQSDLGQGYGVTFFGRDHSKSTPRLAIDVGVGNGLYGAVEKAGLRTVGGHGKSIPAFLLATVVDPEVFDAAFTGEGEVVRGQLVVLKPGEKGTVAYLGPGAMPTARRFVVSKGEVSEAK